MQPATKTGIVTTVIGTVIVFFLTLAMNSLTMPTAQATPRWRKASRAKPATQVRRQVSPCEKISLPAHRTVAPSMSALGH